MMDLLDVKLMLLIQIHMNFTIARINVPNRFIIQIQRTQICW